MECVTRLLSYSITFVLVIHSLIERNSKGQPTYTAIGEDGTRLLLLMNCIVEYSIVGERVSEDA